MKEESILLKEACHRNGFTMGGVLHYSEPNQEVGLLIGSRDLNLFPKEVFRDEISGTTVYESNFLSEASLAGLDTYCMGGNFNFYKKLSTSQETLISPIEKHSLV